MDVIASDSNVIQDVLFASRWRLGERLLWAVWVSLGLCLIYSLFYSAGYLGVSFFVLSNRSMVEHNISGNLTSATWDLAVWSGAIFAVLAWLFYSLGKGKFSGFHRFCVGAVLCSLVSWNCVVVFGVITVASLALVSILLVVLCLLFSFNFFNVSRFGILKGLFFGCILVALLVEGAALILFNLPEVLNLPVKSWAIAVHWQLAELSLSNWAYPLLPYGYLLLISLGVVAFLLKVAPAVRLPENWQNQRLIRFWSRFRLAIESCKEQTYEPLNTRFSLGSAVLISFVASSLFVVVTVLPWINPTYRLVSADAPGYFQWLTHMRGLNVNSALSYALTNDRAAFLILTYALSFLVSPANLMQFMPALLIPLFCLVSLFVVRLVCNFREVWVYTVLMVPFSLQALGLIYSGYFANILAVIFVYVYFVLLLWVFRSGSSLGVFSLLVVSLLVLFSHSWTWYVMVFSLGAFMFLEWRTATQEHVSLRNFKWKTSVVGATVVVGLICDLARNLFTSTSASVSVFETAQSSLSFPNAVYLLGGLKLTTNFYLGGVFANATIIVLSIVGFLFMLTLKSEMSRLLVSWFLVGCVSVLFASSEFVFNRFLFLMPTVIFSSLGLVFILRFSTYNSKSQPLKKLRLELLVVAFVFLVLLNFALRFVSNLNIL